MSSSLRLQKIVNLEGSQLLHLIKYLFNRTLKNGGLAVTATLNLMLKYAQHFEFSWPSRLLK